MSALFDSQIRPSMKPTPAQPVEASSESLIDKHSHFNGHYHSAADLRIEGSAEGDIECDGTVTVAENARAATKIRARNVIVAGDADGEITCIERFTLRPTGKIRGQVQAASLVVEEGAFFEGQFQMADDKVAKPDDRTARPEDLGVQNAKGKGKNPEPAFRVDKPEKLPEPPPPQAVGEEVKVEAKV